jgi:Bacterial Ig-like domain (group 3)
VTFTVTVTPRFSGTVTGSVSFCDGTTFVKTACLNAGVAKFTTSVLAQGTHSITGTHNGSGKFISSIGFADTASKLDRRYRHRPRSIWLLNLAYLPAAGMKVRRYLPFLVNLPPRTLGGAIAGRQLDLNPYNSAQLDAWGELGISSFVLSCFHVLGRIEVEWLEK